MRQAKHKEELARVDDALAACWSSKCSGVVDGIKQAKYKEELARVDAALAAKRAELAAAEREASISPEKGSTPGASLPIAVSESARDSPIMCKVNGSAMSKAALPAAKKKKKKKAALPAASSDVFFASPMGGSMTLPHRPAYDRLLHPWVPALQCANGKLSQSSIARTVSGPSMPIQMTVRGSELVPAPVGGFSTPPFSSPMQTPKARSGIETPNAACAGTSNPSALSSRGTAKEKEGRLVAVF